MAWGAKGGRGVDDLVERLTRGDPSLSSLHIFASRKFGREEVQKLCQALRANTTLKELYASGHHLTPQTAGMLGAMLAANTSLVSICLGDDALGDAGVLELVDGVKQNSTLQKVDLENKGISSKGADSIAAAIQGHQSLQQLVLAHNHLSDEGVRLLQPALALLRRLDLRGCHIGSQGAQCLATALREAHSLEVLRLDDNPLTEHGGSALAAGVWHSQSLRELHLCNTGIGDEGLSRLAQALTHASQLTYLDVSACSIGDEGVSDLADAISDPFHGIADKAMLNEEFHGAAPTPAHLHVLKLRDNQISDHGVKELGEAMQQSSSLQDLDLAGNQVGIQGLKCLSAASVLQKLCLFNCKLGQEAADIVSCFKDNGFSNVRELDLTGNEVEGPQMQSVLEAVQQQDVAPALKVHCYSVVCLSTPTFGRYTSILADKDETKCTSDLISNVPA
ncbi:MAG: hypothetical protein FRX49_03386 [Trebouxia sp. A1-2]|nr:MAG: hypothetical protein FRX49_03386 [Trebouxia sp. A1-2]